MRDYKGIIKERGFFIIAELGVNYYDIAEKNNISIIDAARLMIDKAKENGADAVKFQAYKAEKLTIKDSPAYWDIKEEPTKSQFELFHKYDKFDEDDYKDLSIYCSKKKIIFMSTPFDFEATDFLFDLMPIYKISSSDLNNTPFIEYIASKGKPIFLSTGAATLGEINEAISVITSTGNNDICLLHCILDYPTKNKNINLNMIKYLRRLYPEYLIGYSDHAKPDKNMLITTLAYVYGAKIIEKHFTLDKNIVGNDHYHAMDPSDLKKLVTNLKLVREISGQFKKEPLECEMISRKMARRSIVANIKIDKGDIIHRDNLVFKRPGTGIPPSMLDRVVGGVALRDIHEDEIITFDSIKLKNSHKG